MSRVDDDREAQRAAERIMLQRKQAETKSQQKAGESSAFARLVGQQKDVGGTQDRKSIAEEVLGEALLGSEEQGHVQQHGASRQFRGTLNQKLTDGWKQDSTRGLESHQSETAQQDEQVADARYERRGDEMRSGENSQGEPSGSAAAAKGKGELKSGKDGGGKGDDSGQNDGQGGMGQGFRFNPALMAPVPVAKPKDSGASERLRALANEIAQKIVQNVRVGTNAMGKAEFQIDLKSNVLSGLSIKVSGGNGKIKAVFSGNDREVLKMLRENGQNLKNALAGRGLSLEEFRVEERA